MVKAPVPLMTPVWKMTPGTIKALACPPETNAWPGWVTVRVFVSPVMVMLPVKVSEVLEDAADGHGERVHRRIAGVGERDVIGKRDRRGAGRLHRGHGDARYCAVSRVPLVRSTAPVPRVLLLVTTRAAAAVPKPRLVPPV